MLQILHFAFGSVQDDKIGSVQDDDVIRIYKKTSQKIL